MNVEKADAKNVDDDVIEVIVAIDMNPSKKTKPINKGKDSFEEDEDMDKKSDEDEDEDDDEDCETDWKSLCKQLLQAISLMDTQTDAAMEEEMTDEEAIKAIDQMTSRILWGKQEDNNPFSSYQNMNYGKNVAAGLVMSKEADLEGMGYAPGNIKFKDEEEDEESTPRKPQKKSKGLKHAAKKIMGMGKEPEDEDEDEDKPDDDDDIMGAFDDEEDDDESKPSLRSFGKKKPKVKSFDMKAPKDKKEEDE